MENIELQNLIVQNLLLGLKKQSEAYLDLISNNEYTHDQRKDFEKELSDINKVLNELSGKTINYTVAELEALKVQFNDRLTQLNSIITNLEINTLKIEFDSLTPEQKAFLKGEKGDKGDKGDNSYQLAVRYGFVGNEIEYLNSLKGKDGKDGVNGVNGINGADGQDGLSLTYDSLTSAQKQNLVSFFSTSSVITDINQTLNGLNENFSSFNQNFMVFADQFNSLVLRVEELENSSNGGNTELLSYVSKSISTQDNIEQHGTRVLTNYNIEVGDIVTLEYNINGLIFTNILKAVKPEETLYFDILQSGSDSNFDVAAAAVVSIDGKLVLTTQVFDILNLKRYEGAYTVKVKIEFITPKSLNFDFVEVTQDTLIYEHWMGYDL